MKKLILPLTIIVILAATAVCGAQNAGLGTSIKRSSRQGAIRTPRWSPDGGKVAFVYDIAGNAEVYIADADGTNVVLASNNKAVDINPVWSPDGKTLLFVSNRNGSQFDICRVNSEGEDLECLDNPGDDLWPAWSPDGATVAYCNYVKGYPQVYFMSPDGQSRELFDDRRACHPAFSADGKRIALSSDGDLLIFKLNNKKSKNITEPLIYGNMVDDTMPVWAPRGSRLAFIGRYEAYSSEVYTIAADGKKVRRITDNLFEDFLPCWHPKGKGVLYAAFVQGRQPEIFVSDPETPEKTRLTENHIVEMEPRYSPDGKKIMYIARKRTQDELYIMNDDGTDQRPLLQEPLPTVDDIRKAAEIKRKQNQDKGL